MRIILFIRSLELGGAERQLLNLAEGLAERHDVVVMTFYDADEYSPAGAAVPRKYRQLSLSKRGRWDMLGFAARFIRAVRDIRPDVIYAFMNTASVISLLAPAGHRATRIVWGIRSSNMRLSEYGTVPRIFRWLECKLSAFADLVIANSEAGRAEALADGFRNTNICVIANGIDTGRFARDEAAARLCREALGIPAKTMVIGTVARHDPMKGLEIFLQAAARHSASFSDTCYLIVGSGPAAYTRVLKQMAQTLGLRDNIRWVPKTPEIAPFYRAMDIYTSASIYGEGFSNAVAEAMACEVPCVVTDVGDARHIVGDRGCVVASNSPDALVDAWRSLCALDDVDRRRLGADACERVARSFGIGAMVDKTEAAIVTGCGITGGAVATVK